MKKKKNIATAILASLFIMGLVSCENMTSTSRASTYSSFTSGTLTSISTIGRFPRDFKDFNDSTVLTVTNFTKKPSTADKVSGSTIGGVLGGALGGAASGKNTGAIVGGAALGVAAGWLFTEKNPNNYKKYQTLTLRLTSGKIVKLQQPVYEEFATIRVGTVGFLRVSSGLNIFTPAQSVDVFNRRMRAVAPAPISARSASDRVCSGCNGQGLFQHSDGSIAPCGRCGGSGRSSY